MAAETGCGHTTSGTSQGALFSFQAWPSHTVTVWYIQGTLLLPTQSTLQAGWKTLVLKQTNKTPTKKPKGKRRHVISSRLPALAPQQVACQVGGWVGGQVAAHQGAQLEVGSWLVANPNLEEGEEGLHEQEAGVEVGVGNWGYRLGEVEGSLG